MKEKKEEKKASWKRNTAETWKVWVFFLDWTLEALYALQRLRNPVFVLSNNHAMVSNDQARTCREDTNFTTKFSRRRHNLEVRSRSMTLAWRSKVQWKCYKLGQGHRSWPEGVKNDGVCYKFGQGQRSWNEGLTPEHCGRYHHVKMEVVTGESRSGQY